MNSDSIIPKIVIWILVGFGFQNAICQQEKTIYSLHEAVDYGVAESNKMKQALLDVRSGDAQVLNYWTTGIPKVTANGNYTYNLQLPAQLIPLNTFDPSLPEDEYQELVFGLKNQVNTSLELQALLFSGSFFVGLKAQNLYKELVRKKIDITKIEIVESVTKAYYNVLIAFESLKILRKDLEVLRQSYEDTKAALEVGLVEKLDVDRLALGVQQVTTEIENQETAVQLAKNLLKFQMQYPLDKEIQLSNELAEFTTDMIVRELKLEEQINPENRPEYEPLQLQTELYQANINAINAGYFPVITGFFNYNQSLSRDELFNNNGPEWIGSSAVGVNLSLPIFDGLEKHAQGQEAKIKLEEARLDLNNFERSVQLEVENARLAFISAQNTTQNNVESVELSGNIFKATNTKFIEGLGTSSEVIQAQQDVLNAQRQYIISLYELMIAYVDLKKAEGTL